MTAIPALVVDNLRKTYSNGVEALKGVSLTVEQGDFFALLGPNGAGKSTLIGILSSLVNATSGDARVFGVSVKRERSAAMRLIGLVPQEVNFNQFESLFDICVNEAGFYGIPRKIAVQRAEKYLRELRLWDKAKMPSRELSGGMKRRLMIARALMHKPRLLILDEPTAGVDIEMRRSMWEYLTELNEQGTTIILTTHYLEEAEQLCRNIAIIDHGRIVENTSMRQLLAQLQVETLILDLKEPMESTPELEGYPCLQQDERTLEVQVNKELGLTGLFTQLGECNIEVLSMRNKSNRLEELFVSLVESNLQGDQS